MTCSVDFGQTVSANLIVLADDNRSGAFANVIATIGSGNTIFDSMREAQTFLVDNTNDSGSGSLRDAITNGNNGCTFVPCKVSFRIAADQRIAPLSPLPAMTGSFIIDGRGTIFIDGSNVASGDAITMSGCGGTVQGLAIGNFHGAGVHVLHTDCNDPSFIIAANSLGLDPNGNPAPNDRGVVVVARPARSDIFDQTAAPVISTNIIGLDRTRHTPRGNGASGIYIDGSAIVNANYIAFNHQFGVAVADFNSAAAIGPNSIFANWQRGIDIGLTASSPSFIPLITAAHYDAATNRMLIDVTVSAHVNGSNLTPVVEFYANDAPHPSGFGDGQYFIGGSIAPAGTTPKKR